jgi:hypothetical protein
MCISEIDKTDKDEYEKKVYYKPKHDTQEVRVVQTKKTIRHITIDLGYSSQAFLKVITLTNPG